MTGGFIFALDREKKQVCFIITNFLFFDITQINFSVYPF